MALEQSNPASETFRVQIADLLDLYGNMLTEKQRNAMELYYQDDLSLAEISELSGITRQGVRDALKRSEEILFETEERLGLAARMKSIREQLTKAHYRASHLRNYAVRKPLPTEVVQLIDAMMKNIDFVLGE